MVPVFLVQRDNWAVEEVIRIPAKDVTGWIMPKMPGLCALKWCFLFPPERCFAQPGKAHSLTAKALLRKHSRRLVGGAEGLRTLPRRHCCPSWSLCT